MSREGKPKEVKFIYPLENKCIYHTSIKSSDPILRVVCYATGRFSGGIIFHWVAPITKSVAGRYLESYIYKLYPLWIVDNSHY